MRRLAIVFIIALIIVKIVSATHQDYDHLVRSSVYLVHSLDIATDLLIKERDIFYAQANKVELTGALCEVLGRLIALNKLFNYDLLSESIQHDATFWLYVKERVVYFIEGLSGQNSDGLIQLVVSQLQIWNEALKTSSLVSINA